VCMEWLCFLGASVATEHMFIDSVVTWVPRRLAHVLEIISLTLAAGVLLVLVRQRSRLVEWTRYATAIALGIPTVPMYVAIPISAFRVQNDKT